MGGGNERKGEKRLLQTRQEDLGSSLNDGNVAKPMNTWDIPAVRYTAGILD